MTCSIIPLFTYREHCLEIWVELHLSPIVSPLGDDTHVRTTQWRGRWRVSLLPVVIGMMKPMSGSQHAWSELRSRCDQKTAQMVTTRFSLLPAKVDVEDTMAQGSAGGLYWIFADLPARVLFRQCHPMP